jgi:hypothetical protein
VRPLVFAVLVLSCGCPPARELPPLQVPEGCQPLMAGADCLLPFPSDFFRQPSADLPTGFRLQETAPSTWRASEGASRLPMPTAFLAAEVSPASLTGLFDRIDGVFWGRFVLAHPVPGHTPRRVLMQTGLGDPEVPNVAAFMHARALGLKQLTPTTFPVFGLETVSSPTRASALQVYDHGIDLRAVYERAQPSLMGNEVHEATRRLPTALDQLGAFFGARDEVVSFCEGACDPN